MIPTLGTLRRNSVVLVATAVAWASSACATASRTTFTAPDLPPPSRSVALLPVDVAVTLDGMGDIDPEEQEAIRAEAIAEVRRLLEEELPRRGYEVSAALDWDGNGRVDPQAIADAVDGLLAHANAVAWEQPAGGTIDPALTRYLGEQTGAGTLLYVNGTALANTSAKKTWQAALVVGAVLAVVATAVAVGSAAKHRGKSSSGSSRAGHRSSYRSHHHHHHGGGGGAVLIVGGPVIFHSHRAGAPPPPEPVEAEEEAGFFDGDRIRLTATLVDAETGEILWHADEQQGLDPRDRTDLAAYLGDLLEDLPRTAGTPAAAGARE